MTRSWIVVSVLVVVSLHGVQSTGYGQSPAAVPDLRMRLHERFDVVALQQGVALVPLAASATIRMIQVVNGVVTVDGESLTGQQLRDRLGPDSELVIETSHLDVQRQRALAGTAPAARAAPFAQTPEDAMSAQVTSGAMVRFGGDVTVTSLTPLS